MKKLFLGLMLTAGFSEAQNSWYGPTGLITIPTTSLVGDEKAFILGQYGVGGNDPYLAGSLTMSFADRIEFSLYDDSGFKGRPGNSTVASAKYSPVSNCAFGVMMDQNEKYRNVGYAMLGSPTNDVYIGIGTVFGSSKSPYALLGNYDLATKEMDSLFLMGGARMDLSLFYPATELKMEFNGDSMGLGISYMPLNNIHVNLDYQAKGDLITDDRFLLSCGVRF